MDQLQYVPPPSVEGFLYDDSFIDLVIGPFGCVSADTEYLTPSGWLPIGDYPGGPVAQWNPETGQAEFVTPEYIKLPCDNLIHFEHTAGLSQVLSPEHRMVYRLRRKGDKLHERTAGEVMDWHLRNGADMIRIPVTFGAPDRAGLALTDDEIRLAVAVQADSYVPPGGRQVVFNLKRSRKIARLLALLDRLQLRYTEHKAGEGYRRFYVWTHLRDKEFGPLWWRATAHQLAVIADEAPHWDGGTSAKGLSLYRTTSKRSADFIQYAFVSTGRKTSLSLTTVNNVWLVSASAVGADHVGIAGVTKAGPKSVNTRWVRSLDGYKYCFSVPSTYLILRHNDCVFVTGNSTKTTAAIMKIAYHAAQMAPSKDGIRRSRCVWVRNTREQLRDTSIPDFVKWFPDGVAGVFHKTEGNFTLRFGDVECLVMFRGLDDANDVRRLLSLQVSFGVIDEFREIKQAIFEALQGRLGRYPDKLINGVGCVTDDGRPNKHLWGASNPPDADTFWEAFLSKPPPNTSVYFQPSGLSTEADWLQYLPPDYYENLAQGKTEDWIDVYINGKFGKSLAGRPVFSAFKTEFHIAKEPIKHIKSPDRPLIIGMDFGLNPSVTINQIDFKGRLLTLHSLTSSGMGALRFVQTLLKPTLASRFPGMPLVIVGDPAGSHRAQTDERSCFDILRQEGFRVVPARTNSIVARIAAVDSYLTRQIDGGPAALFDPIHATGIIASLRGQYRYKLKRNGEAEDQPEKNDASHTADAHQYACLLAQSGGGMGAPAVHAPPQLTVAPAAGWT